MKERMLDNPLYGPCSHAKRDYLRSVVTNNHVINSVAGNGVINNTEY
jgi:hypothetical protein